MSNQANSKSEEKQAKMVSHKEKTKRYTEKLTESVANTLGNFATLNIGSAMEIDDQMSTNDRLMAMVKREFFSLVFFLNFF